MLIQTFSKKHFVFSLILLFILKLKFPKRKSIVNCNVVLGQHPHEKFPSVGGRFCRRVDPHPLLQHEWGKASYYNPISLLLCIASYYNPISLLLCIASYYNPFSLLLCIASYYNPTSLLHCI